MSRRESDLTCAHSSDAAAYVLGALEEGAAERYREHIVECASCRHEVADLQLVADQLPVTAPPAPAPDALRARIMATVRSEAELLQAAGHEADRPPRLAGRWRSPLALSGAAAAIAVGAALAFAIVVGIGSGGREHVTTAQHISASAVGAQATLRQRDGRAELTVSGMPQPPLGKIYEVWLSRGAGSAEPTDALFGVTSRGRGSVAVPRSLHGVKEVMVTSEPLGGSAKPTSPPLIRVVLNS